MKLLLLSVDTDVIDVVDRYCSEHGHELAIIGDLAQARVEIRSRSHDAILMDCSIRPSELIDVSSELSDALAGTVVLLIGPLDHTQRQALGKRLSAHYSVDKPLRGKAFEETMQRVLLRSTIVRDVGLIGVSPVMEETVQTIMQVGPTPINVLVTGESGTGKEVVARAVHAVSRRAERPFLAVNCAALAEGVLESELFGHEKGSFTGAASRRIGMFEKADKGTIFLDEIGEISASTQIRLLRVLEEREIMRVGGTDIIPVDVRVIAATNSPLEKLVENGTFRRDLYYRIKVLEIKVPPLRNRPEDIPLLIDRIARQYAIDNDLPLRAFARDAKDALSQANWAGNVRELRNFVESCLALTSVSTIHRHDIPEDLYRDVVSQNMLPVPMGEKFTDRAERELLFRTLLELKHEIAQIKELIMDRTVEHDKTDLSRMVEVYPLENPREMTLDDMERQAIIETLEHTDGNRRKAAEMLGIGERTLYRKLKQYDIS